MKNLNTPLRIVIILLLFSVIDVVQAQWTNLNSPGSNYETYQSLAVSVDGKNLIAYMSDLSGNAFIVSSHDYGNSWQKYPQAKVGYTIPTAPVSYLTTFWVGDVVYYVAADVSFKKSTDFGATITTVSSIARSTSFPILILPNGNWYVADAGYNWVSTDNGSSWTKTTGGVYGVGYVTANNGEIVVLQNNTIIGYSADGLNWNKSSVPSGIAGGGNSPRLSKAANGTILAFFYSTPSTITISTDNGHSFQKVNGTIPANTNIMYYYGNDMIAVDILGNTYISTDNGLNFSKINSSKLLTTVSGMITNGKNIYLYGMSGIYSYGTVKTGTNNIHTDINLVVFPNPCSDKLYLHSDKEFSNYSIFDLAGKLVEQNKPTKQYIDVNSIEKGTYILKISGVDGQISKVKFTKR